MSSMGSFHTLFADANGWKTALILAGLICCIVLMFKRGFWIFSIGIGSVMSCLALLDALIHFQIIVAIGYFFLMLVCWAIAREIANGHIPPNENKRPQDQPIFKNDDPDWSPD